MSKTEANYEISGPTFDQIRKIPLVGNFLHVMWAIAHEYKMPWAKAWDKYDDFWTKPTKLLSTIKNTYKKMSREDRRIVVTQYLLFRRLMRVVNWSEFIRPQVRFAECYVLDGNGNRVMCEYKPVKVTRAVRGVTPEIALSALDSFYEFICWTD